MKNIYIIAILLAITTGLPSYAGDGLQSKSIEITATPIELNTENPQQKTIGKLKYITGYHLTSNDEGFGGISGLDWFRGKKDKFTPSFKAVTDKGLYLAFGFNPVTLEPSLSATMFLLPNLPKDLPQKTAGDAEAFSIFIKSDVFFLVAFEQRHRIVSYGTGLDTKPLPLPAEIDQLQSNGGLETMETLSDGRLLLMAEHPTIKTKQHFAWIGTAPKGDPLNFSYITRLIAPPEGYSPTDATELPNGDVLVLLRRFTPADGVSAKFWRISKAMLDESGPITGDIIATLKPPLSVDNMEGIAVIDVSADGNPIIAVVSDDNFNPLQRTLLMIFEVIEQ